MQDAVSHSVNLHLHQVSAVRFHGEVEKGSPLGADVSADLGIAESCGQKHGLYCTVCRSLVVQVKGAGMKQRHLLPGWQVLGDRPGQQQVVNQVLEPVIQVCCGVLCEQP